MKKMSGQVISGGCACGLIALIILACAAMGLYEAGQSLVKLLTGGN